MIMWHVKDPLSTRLAWILSAKLKKKTHEIYLLQVCDGKLMLRRNHRYYYQVQGQLNISGYNKCDFIVSTGTGEMSVEEID